jgi:hypothetical protein
MTPIITTNPHDGGFDLVAGALVTGKKVGRVYWDAGDSDAGLVLRLNGEQHLPDDIESVVALLDEEGYDLTAESRSDIAGLVPRCEANARKGTGTGICDRPLGGSDQCDRASDHIEF